MAWFYHDSRITYITLALSTTFLIGGFRVQHLALLKRQMRFKAIALIEVGSMATGVLVGIVMALLHYRYWSLVGLTLGHGDRVISAHRVGVPLEAAIAYQRQRDRAVW